MTRKPGHRGSTKTGSLPGATGIAPGFAPPDPATHQPTVVPPQMTPRISGRMPATPQGGGAEVARAALEQALAQHRAGHRTGRLEPAIAAYRDIAARWPMLAAAQNLLGLALHQSGRQDEALAALDRAIALDDADPDFRNHRGIVLLALGRIGEAADEFRRALALRPNDARALANLGNALKAGGDRGAALDHYRRAIEADPSYAEAYFNLGNTQRETGDFDGAAGSYRQAIARNPAFAPAHANLGGLLFDAGDAAGARRAYEAAIAAGGTQPGFLYGHAMACDRLGDVAAAEAEYRRLLAAMPAHADALNNLGGLLERSGRIDEARDHYERALQAAPQHGRAAFNLGQLHARRGDADRAARHILAAKAVSSGDAAALARIGAALAAIDRGDDAIDCFRSALDLAPDDAGLHGRLGGLLLERRDTEKAFAHLEFAREQGADDAALHHALGLAHFRLCRLDRALDGFRAAIERDPATLAFRSAYLMALNYSDEIAPADLFAEHRRIMAPVNDATPARPPRRAANGGRLRIGYVSADFREHSCAHFLRPVFEAHDRERVEIVCYSNHRRRDATTDAFMALSDRWRDILALDDTAAAALVREDGIDLLVDLGGHTGDNRLGLFRRRPAALQASWLGYPNTTALDTIDLRLTDAIADPSPAADALHTERLLRIENGFLAYRMAAALPPPRADRATGGAPVRFGCFNNANKISPTTIALWAQILDAVPGATLALRTEHFRHESVRTAFGRRFAAAGTDPARIRFLTWQNDIEAALAGHAEIDIALDPTPYNGTTTTCEALAMGVPVVALAGDRHAARVGASLLTLTGLRELVATTPADYVRIAIALAGDRTRLSNYRAGLRAQLSASPLCDGRRLAVAIETAVQAAE
jgi:protein O-GlcNAc transferase